ncbi:MAG TPA: glycosyltransferase [Myxococcota bacterium]|jgi:glycosyltransferase involved in cell wall biosynthesis
MDASVVICTWNRAQLLDRTLSGMRSLRIPKDLRWELLVVNNNCTDDTDAVVERHASALPIRRLHQPVPGKVHAVHLAMSQARGSLIVWTDDDVLPSEGWLAAYVAARKRWPEAGLFGGPIIPDFESAPPRWIAATMDRVGGAYGLRNPGPDPIELTHATVPFGANFAIPRRVQLEYPYDTRLGDFAGRRISGYETRVMWRMLDDGIRGRWVPDARVRHFVPRAAMSTAFLRRYFMGKGHADALVDEDRFADQPRLFGKPVHLVRRAVEAELNYRIRRVCCRPQTWTRALVKSSVLWGRLQGL